VVARDFWLNGRESCATCILSAISLLQLCLSRVLVTRITDWKIVCPLILPHLILAVSAHVPCMILIPLRWTLGYGFATGSSSTGYIGTNSFFLDEASFKVRYSLSVLVLALLRLLAT